ncbi:MAG: nucleoside hydrolase [Brevefilum sp.]
MVEKIILDVDTGSDDAVAIMTAILSPDIQLEAVCSVAGNKDIDKTTENTLRVVQHLDSDVPVYRGCAEPLVKCLRENRRPKKVPGLTLKVDGKEVQMHADYLDLPPAEIQEGERPASVFYVDYLRQAESPVTLVAVGPLTNLAVAFMLDPTIVKKVKKIVVMGGGYQVTNATSTAEFNIWYDPEAAQRVLDSGAEVIFVPLDATHKACVSQADCDLFREINTKASGFAAELIEQRIIMHNAFQPLEIADAAAVHDALAVCYVIDGSVLKDVREVHCEIGFSGIGEGQTVIDPRFYTEDKNCLFAFDGDRERFLAMLTEILGLEK